jgi:hypothetical protein
MQSTIDELRLQYKSLTNRDYQSSRYPRPQSTPQDLLRLVATIKVLSAEARQLEIIAEVRKGEAAGEAFIVNDRDWSLIPEYDGLRAEIDIWGPYR